MKFLLAPLAASCVLLFAGAASAALYSDRTSFEAAAQNLTTTGFERLIGTPEYPANYPLPTGTYNTTSAGITVAGMKFVGNDSQYGYSTYNLAGFDNFSLDGTTALVLHSTVADIHLPAGISAFGTDFGFSKTLVSKGPIDVTIFLHDNTTASLTLDTEQFFGYVGKLIDRIHFDGRGTHYPQAKYLLVDNVSVGQSATAVPEPSIYALLLVGLGAIGGMRMRRVS